MSGIYISIPFTPVSFWIEWREQPLGFALEVTSPRDRELFAGRVHVIASIEPATRRGNV